jgi:membrane protein
MPQAAHTTERAPAIDRDGRRDAPAAPTDLRPRAWRAVLSRTVREFKDDNLTVWAAALTYYGVLAIFPALIALVSILGLVGTSATQPLLDNLAQVAPGPVKDILTNTLENLQKSRGSAGVMFFVGLGVALWSASGYVAGFMQASNAIYDIPEGRPIWKTVPVRLGVTVVLVVLLAISAVAVVLTGSIASQAGNVVGVGDTAVMIWGIVKWPILVFIVSLVSRSCTTRRPT